MKVKVFDVDQPDREVEGKYTIDTTLGVPAIGDELLLLERDYNPDRPYLSATVRRRRWVLANNAPTGAVLQLWVQRHGN